jgi:hypothetical protein
VIAEFYTRGERGIPRAWVNRMGESMARPTPRFSTSRTVREYTEEHPPLEPTMKTDMRSENTVRETILKLLSDEEVARVSTAETAVRLPDGDEYLDLEHPAHGVQRASGTALPMGSVLPKMAVHESTWSKILAQLEPSRAPVAHRAGHVGGSAPEIP